MGYRVCIMIMQTKNDIFNEYLAEYLKADKGKKGEILNHVCFVTKMHRKASVRKFKHLQMKDPCKTERRGRETFYTHDVTDALKDIWEASSEVCGELLHPIIKEYVEIFVRDKMWKHGLETTDKLLFMSEATTKRRVSTFMKARRRRKGLSSTKPSLLKVIVPIFTGPWEGKPPGFGQIDTVAHCGSSLLGDFVYTLNYTDVATFWVVPRAQWNKGMMATNDSMKYIKDKLPFPWLGAHPDTGNEFINRFVIDWCQKENIEMTRSRPGHKNDNMFVEERNGHVIRKFVGYNRLDCRDVADVLNGMYDILALFLNHFVPVKRCIEKNKIGSRYKRKYEKKAKTPYQRVLEHECVSKEIKEKLMDEHKKLNPLVLKNEIDKLIKKVYDMQKRHGNSRDLS